MTTLEKIMEQLKHYDGPPIQIMEVCGTHTSAILKTGVKDLVSDRIKLISGPGCPVCVTPASFVDRLVSLSLQPNTCILSFGDMMKVTGTEASLTGAKAKGGHVSLIHSPLQAIKLAEENPDIQYIIAAVGFETTTPSYALLIDSMVKNNIKNIKLLTSLKTISPAIGFVCENVNDIDAFLCPGHVSVIVGSKSFEHLAELYHKPFVIAGFDGPQILAAVLAIVYQICDKKGEMKNLYKSVVSYDGNPAAQNITQRYFTPYDALWRGIGVIGGSGLRLRDEYAFLDAGTEEEYDRQAAGCSCSDIILGKLSPEECPLFGGVCTPLSPVGPCMVSAEGACGIYYRFGKRGMTS